MTSTAWSSAIEWSRSARRSLPSPDRIWTNVCLLWLRVVDGRPLTRPELEILRRSVGASGGLPADQIQRLIRDADELLVEREAVEALLRELGATWSELRRVLNELHAAVKRNRSG